MDRQTKDSFDKGRLIGMLHWALEVMEEDRENVQRGLCIRAATELLAELDVEMEEALKA